MKYCITVFMSLLLFCVLHAQSWFTDGATWYYNDQELVSFDAHGYSQITVIKDTLINDTVAKFLQSTNMRYDGTVKGVDTIFVYEEKRRVYLYDSDHFVCYYDFSLEVGDTLPKVPNGYADGNISLITVDSISYDTINGIVLKEQYIKYKLYTDLYWAPDNILFDKIVERVGSETSFMFYPTADISEEFVYSGLRCYTDSDLHYENAWWRNKYPDDECDAFVNGSVGISVFADDDIVVYPTSVKDYLTIDLKYNDVCQIDFIKLDGEIVLSYSLTQSDQIDVSELAGGIYLIRVSSTTYFTNVSQIIKQ